MNEAQTRRTLIDPAPRAAEGESGVKGTYLFKWGEEGGADRPEGKIFKLDEETSQRYHLTYDNSGLRFVKTLGMIIYVR